MQQGGYGAPFNPMAHASRYAQEQVTPAAGMSHPASDRMSSMGPPMGAAPTSAYNGVSSTHFVESDALAGMATRIATTVENVLFSEHTVMTQLLPWMYIPGDRVEWTELTFANFVASEVPEEGNSRLLESMRADFSATTRRIGIAFEMEAGYAATPQGQRQWIHSVNQAQRSIQSTANVTSIRALLTCKTLETAWREAIGAGHMDIRRILDDEVKTFGSMNSMRGSDRLATQVERHRQLISGRGGVASALLCAQGVRAYMTMVPEEKIDYAHAGPDGPERLRKGPAAVTTLLGISVYETPTYDVSPDSDAIDLLVRDVAVAEFYPMVDNVDAPVAEYTSRARGVFLYNENADSFVNIPVREALEHSRIFTNSGTSYSREVGRLTEAYNASHRPRHDMSKDTNDTQTFFLTMCGTDGIWRGIEYMGQMELQHMTSKYVERIGASAARDFAGPDGSAKWDDFLALMNDLETAPASSEFFKAVVEANYARSLTTDQKFKGELTPDARIAASNTTRIREWAPSKVHGTLDLPMDPAFEGTVPPGYASAPDLRALAAHANLAGSPYRSIGARASTALVYIESMMRHMRRQMPSSGAFDKAAVPPWFHLDDALPVFLSTILGRTPAPLFLAALPIISGRGTASTTDSTATGGVDWFTLPGTGGMPSIPDVRRRADMLADLTVGESGVVIAGTTTVHMPGGGSISVSAAEFAGVIVQMPEIAAVGYMPSGNDATSEGVRLAFFKIAEEMKTRDAMAKFAHVVTTVGSGNTPVMWAVLSGMYAATDAADMMEAVNSLYATAGATSEEIAAIRASISTYTAMAKIGVSDLDPTAMISEEWVRRIPDIASSDAMVSRADLAARIQAAADRVRGANISADDLLGDVTIARATAADNGLGTELTAIRTALRRIYGSSESAAFQTVGGGGAGVIRVSDVGDEMVRARYFRSPLVATRGVVGSLLEMYGGRMAKPIAVPGDRSAAYTIPMSWHGDTVGADSATSLFGAPVGALDAELHAHFAHATTDSALDPASGAATSVGAVPMMQRHLLAEEATRGTGTASFDEGFAADVAMGGVVGYDDADDDDFFETAGVGGAFVSASAALGASASASVPSAFGSPLKRMAPDHHYADAKGIPSTARAIMTGALEHRWNETVKISNAAVRAAARVFLLTKADNLASWSALIDADVCIPATFILARPNIRHAMSSCILMQPGSETGGNFWGRPNVAQGGDANSKRLVYNLTIRMMSIVTRPKNVAIIPNIKFERYIGGHNTDFVSSPKNLDVVNVNAQSLIALATGPSDTHFDQYIDLAPLTSTARSAAGELAGKHTYASAEFYDGIYSLGSGTTYHQRGQLSFLDFSTSKTSIAMQGAHYSYNTATGDFSTFHQPKGHIGLNQARPGGAAVMNGVDASFTAFDYASLRLS